ncbi:hypothetical protein [Alkalihalobacterium bogoriense]|uniref:hypothetical protein n=1 Tax=Alkalihalobacterium bogoriense TaxID=246272 RepID=UPI001C58A0A1|nr:hypothetical protein [Alkalihalobacterium bogoriense]
MVRDFDLMDGGDPMTPPMFSCETCGGEMDPEYYKGVHGVEYSTGFQICRKQKRTE